MKILLEIAFVGTAYCGFQVQENAPSVQKTLQNALEMLFDTTLLVSGCSRTDSKVHARQFYCTAEGKIPTAFPLDKLPTASLAFLPKDISILSAKQVPDSFHVRYDVQYKEYEYVILNTAARDPFMNGRVWHYSKRLDAEALDKAAQAFVGQHDFAAFMAAGSQIVDTVRTIYAFHVEREGTLVKMRVAADGFLYNMVRILCGTLIAVAEGKIKPEALPAVIASKDRRQAGMTLPPEGLYLSKVVY